mmetsp:Transcript_13967/g.48227  ORF Transcript_13967/g.48227 Transcript_13967/m.48227 type:complete len:260 (-) Transcript_13967:254-1033(-)
MIDSVTVWIGSDGLLQQEGGSLQVVFLVSEVNSVVADRFQLRRIHLQNPVENLLRIFRGDKSLRLHAAQQSRIVAHGVHVVWLEAQGLLVQLQGAVVAIQLLVQSRELAQNVCVIRRFRACSLYQVTGFLHLSCRLLHHGNLTQRDGMVRTQPKCSLEEASGFFHPVSGHSQHPKSDVILRIQRVQEVGPLIDLEGERLEIGNAVLRLQLFHGRQGSGGREHRSHPILPWTRMRPALRTASCHHPASPLPEQSSRSWCS